MLNRKTLCSSVLAALLAFTVAARADGNPRPAPAEVAVDADATELVVVRGGARYLVDLKAGSVRELGAEAAQGSSSSAGQQPSNATQPAADAKPGHYVVGDVRLVTLPTAQTLPKGGMLVDFAHRFPYGPVFSGPALGHTLAGLDTFAIPSFGFDYGVTDRLSLSVYRSPSVIGRPIEMRAAVKLASEKDKQPLDLVARFSVDGANDFTRNFITSFELIASRSLGSRAQLTLVPTLSLHNRPLLQLSGPLTAAPFEQPCSQALATGVPASFRVKPCANTFALGVGLAVDVRPTVALVAEVDPTLANGPELGIHRPAYAFGIKKKIWRHAFTFGFTNAPGTTVAQRIGTRAIFLQDPSADKPSGLFIGFNLSRQLR